ncbi:glycolate oxidase subunit GlcF [Sphingomonas histidinilytica]|jgi:glycolate oxidase iron-sulfur subunit|uniref:Glycolate oxidase iron-sulfur subunit n=1 Tax=Rhizorhabdus histidinilytica TaxID=439228 RepID=A0A1T5BL08_9SPHN|nr:glycolate oxidase subunit GlcF [Rhizorhabdus histidinilytica]MBO9377384.1 glycolate oxidase subunit GlcF [Rhizorhabdus histidinilytica]QEH77564.1 glycolate oxidase subunit GlcF [Sphingomonas sp. C8-2]SKB47670.1 glycolate oxidase iron-sulfur subunit [Rhizorhabdus histidinilytica]
MRTDFSPEQLADPATAVAEAVIRKCVHCGFCTATCPTYVLLGDELDSPRGRIYLIQNMLEKEAEPTPQVVRHVDRCLSCLSCMTTCPSGVNYMHLVDHARAYIERHYRRPLAERLIRSLLAAVLPHPGRFRLALALARLARPTAPLLARIGWARPLAAMLSLAPRNGAGTATHDTPRPTAPVGRVALLQGCAEPVLKPEVRAATIRLLGRLGYQAVLAPGEGCCGALVHHMGREEAARDAARRNVDAWSRQIDEAGGLDAILITASGCGTTIKDYGFLLRDDPVYADRAARVSALAKDVSEFLDTLDLPAGDGRGLTVAYHPACSLQHGQKITEAPKRLLARMGYRVKTPAEAHLCCGSAGTYNILQPELAGKLGDRKAAAIDRLGADVIATGNIGCAMQIGMRSATPLAHVVELVDWASGGPAPESLSRR